MFSSIKTNFLEITGFPSLKVRAIVSLFSYILLKATNYTFRCFIAGLGTLEFGSGIVKSFLQCLVVLENCYMNC